MKLLVFGRTGQVARELQRLLPAGIEADFLDRGQADLAQPEACAAIIADSDADAVINVAAYTAVDKAEEEETLAGLVNGIAPGAMAEAAAKKALPFLHISTDYVFDGTGDTPFAPDDPTAPLGTYGRTKLAGEQAIRQAGGNALILRTSWVFSAHGSNFVKTMLRLGKERGSLNVVSDQVGGPTPASAIARALIAAARRMAEGEPGGVHHFAGKPDASWADFARAIMEQAGLDCTVYDIATSEYPTPALRPASSRLDCSSFAAAFGIARPDWRAALKEVIEEIEQ